MLMAKKKSTTDRHKPARMVRIREILAVQLDKIAERDATDLTEVVNTAVRKFLIAEGYWPPPEVKK
jgi:hypothetical protein